MRRIGKATALLFTLLVVWSSSQAETMYVTDKLILGVYDNSEGSGQQIRIVRSGAQLEVTERVGRYAKVVTDTGEEGWVKSQYLVSNAPAVLRINELEAQLQAGQGNELLAQCVAGQPAPQYGHAGRIPTPIACCVRVSSDRQGRLPQERRTGADGPI